MRLGLLAAVALAACELAGPAGAGEPFDGAARSLDALGRMVLEAVDQGDAAAIDRHRLTESEHNGVIWPELPASAPEVSFPVDYAWRNIQQRHHRSTARMRSMLGGSGVAFRDVECRGPTEPFATFEVRTDCWVIFEREEDGGRFEVQLFKDVVVRGGGYKYFRLYDEEPRPVRAVTSAGDAGRRAAPRRTGRAGA